MSDPKLTDAERALVDAMQLNHNHRMGHDSHKTLAECRYSECRALSAFLAERAAPAEPGGAGHECRHSWTLKHSPLCEHLMDHQGTCVCGKWKHDAQCAEAAELKRLRARVEKLERALRSMLSHDGLGGPAFACAVCREAAALLAGEGSDG